MCAVHATGRDKITYRDYPTLFSIATGQHYQQAIGSHRTTHNTKMGGHSLDFRADDLTVLSPSVVSSTSVNSSTSVLSSTSIMSPNPCSPPLIPFSPILESGSKVNNGMGQPLSKVQRPLDISGARNLQDVAVALRNLSITPKGTASTDKTNAIMRDTQDTKSTDMHEGRGEGVLRLDSTTPEPGLTSLGLNETASKLGLGKVGPRGSIPGRSGAAQGSGGAAVSHPDSYEKKVIPDRGRPAQHSYRGSWRPLSCCPLPPLVCTICGSGRGQSADHLRPRIIPDQYITTKKDILAYWKDINDRYDERNPCSDDLDADQPRQYLDEPGGIEILQDREYPEGYPADHLFPELMPAVCPKNLNHFLSQYHIDHPIFTKCFCGNPVHQLEAHCDGDILMERLLKATGLDMYKDEETQKRLEAIFMEMLEEESEYRPDILDDFWKVQDVAGWCTKVERTREERKERAQVFDLHVSRLRWDRDERNDMYREGYFLSGKSRGLPYTHLGTMDLYPWEVMEHEPPNLKADTWGFDTAHHAQRPRHQGWDFIVGNHTKEFPNSD